MILSPISTTASNDRPKEKPTNGRAEGGFTVSARRRHGATLTVRVRATVPAALRLRNPFGAIPFRVTGGRLEHTGETLTGFLQPGQTLRLSANSELSARIHPIHA